MRIQSVTQRQTCAPLRKFPTRDAASAAARNIAANRGVQRLPYPCSKCNGWHLSGGGNA